MRDRAVFPCLKLVVVLQSSSPYTQAILNKVNWAIKLHIDWAILTQSNFAIIVTLFPYCRGEPSRPSPNRDMGDCAILPCVQLDSVLLTPNPYTDKPY